MPGLVCGPGPLAPARVGGRAAGRHVLGLLRWASNGTAGADCVIEGKCAPLVQFSWEQKKTASRKERPFGY